MSRVIKLNKGLDIHLVGEAEKKISQLPMADRYAVCPMDFEGVIPKLLVQQGETVKAGSPLFFDKSRPELLFTSPVSGTVTAINRGDKRRIDEIVVTPSRVMDYLEFTVDPIDESSREQILNILLSSGLWACIIQRPYGIIANPYDIPKSIFISGFDSAPLAPDIDYALQGESENLNKGIEVLSKLTSGKVHLGIRNTKGIASKIKGVESTLYEGPHPAGNVGVQIHHTDPVGKDEKVWTLNIQHVATIGRLFNTGKVIMKKVIALTGSEVSDPRYYSVIEGAPIDSIVRRVINMRVCDKDKAVRIISGNVLTGRKTKESGYIGFYYNQITVIPEGDNYEFLGWMMPRFDKLSVSKTFFSWLCPKKEYVLDTNLNGGRRAFVLSGLYEKYFPMDIYPIYLLKAILAGDIDKMENLGIYDVIEEDIALCEFVDPSKTEMQELIRHGINLMIKELS